MIVIKEILQFKTGRFSGRGRGESPIIKVE